MVNERIKEYLFKEITIFFIIHLGISYFFNKRLTFFLKELQINMGFILPKVKRLRFNQRYMSCCKTKSGRNAHQLGSYLIGKK